MQQVGESRNDLATCPLATDPKACFSRYQESHLRKRNRHSWESIGECDGCRFARINAEIAHVPEPDIDFSDMRWAKVDPRDFEERPVVAEKTPEKRGHKPKACCPRGHSFALHGRVNKGGSRHCRVCEAALKRARYQMKKEVAA